MMEAQEHPAVQAASFLAQRLPVLRAHIRTMVRRLNDGTKTRD